MKGEGETPFLQIRDLVKTFGDFTAVDGISLDITESEFFTIVGPSGSGKTTMIRMLVGMDSPDSGDIMLKGRRLNDVPANRRPTCMVFQSLALFPHKTVGENIEFPMKIAKVAPAERRRRADLLLEQLRLPLSYYDKGVNQCSGGERQRVALARALAYDPEILFFDEPLASLDFRLRKTLEKELKDVHRETGKTFVYITHSLEEAMVMSDRIGIMRDGHMVQVGTPAEIYNRPVNKFVAQFMGEVNTIEVTRAGDNTVKSLSGDMVYTVAGDSFDRFEKGFLVIRPEVMKIGPAAEALPNRLAGTLFNDYALGSRIQYQVRGADDSTWLVEKLQDNPFDGALGDSVTIGWQPKDSILVMD